MVCMMAISSPQYVWTLFTKPLGIALGVAPVSVQITFSLLIVLQTFFLPFQGWLVDRFGPKLLIEGRPVHQRADLAVLRLGVDPGRGREHGVPGVKAGGGAMAVWLATRPDPLLFVLLPGVVFLGWANLLAVSVHADRCVRPAGCDAQLRVSVYRAGDRGHLRRPDGLIAAPSDGNMGAGMVLAIAADLLTAVLASARIKPLRARYPTAG